VSGREHIIHPCGDGSNAEYTLTRVDNSVVGLKVEQIIPGQWTLLVEFADGSESEPTMSAQGMRLNIHDLGYMEMFIRSVEMNSGANYTAVGTPGLPGMGTLLITEGMYVYPGDVNSDRVVNISDILDVRGFIFGEKELAGESFFAADCEQDGVLNLSDILVIKGIIFGENGKD